MLCNLQEALGSNPGGGTKQDKSHTGTGLERVKLEKQNTPKNTFECTMLTRIYNEHLTTCLSKTEYLMISMLLNLLQNFKNVKLEKLTAVFPFPIVFESRRKKLKRFLESQCLTIEAIWIPIISKWIETEFDPKLGQGKRI